MGKTLVAQQPLRISADQLDATRKTMRKFLGKYREFRILVNATLAVCRRPQGTKRGQGRGSIDRYVARVPAGRPIVQVPAVTPLPLVYPNWQAFRSVACALPGKFQFRDQTNHFAMDRASAGVSARIQMEQWKREGIIPGGSDGP